MNDWDDEYYGSYYIGEAMAYLMYLFVLITPVIPAGDVGILLIKLVTNEHPRIIYLILAWVFSVWIYFLFLKAIYNLMENYIPYFVFIIFAYIQGIFFAGVLVAQGNAVFSKYVINVVAVIYGLLSSKI